MSLVDELDGFEETWKGKARNQLPGLYGGFNLLGETGKYTRICMYIIVFALLTFKLVTMQVCSIPSTCVKHL